MIRKARAGDIAPVAQIYEHIHNEEEAGRAQIGWVRGVYPTEETAREAFSAGELFVCETDGRVVAAARINQRQVPEYALAQWQYPAEDREIMVLHTLVVDPEAAGQGIGSRFVRSYEAYARSRGCRYLRMDTNERNLAARRLYQHLGYREAGTVPCCFNGIPGVQLVCLEKRLEEALLALGDRGYLSQWLE